jgi:dolichyl-phosphate beta-glucosyltransferase
MKTTHLDESGLLERSVTRLAAGLLVASLLWLAVPPVPPAHWLQLVAGSLAAVAAGMLVRGFELRAAFGSGISLHQSQSLQLVLDFARWASPLQPRRRLETELVARETSVSPERVASWSGARQRWRLALLPVVGFLGVACLADEATLAAALGVLSLLAGIAAAWPRLRAIAAGQPEAREALRGELAMLLVTSTALLVEALLLRRVLPSGSGLAAAWVFVAFGIVRAVPVVPFAVGTWQASILPALLLAGAAAAGTHFAALSLQLAWLLLSGIAAAAYLPRYKLRGADFFDLRLATQLARSRRPAGGWRDAVDAHPVSAPLSIVIPAYNERLRLPAYLPLVAGFVEREVPQGEVLVVDDGSVDDTASYVLACSETHPCVRLVRRPANGGKGRAVLDGVEAARGAWILIADADGATPIEEARLLLQAAATGHEIVIGSRVVGAAARGRDALRALLGRVFYGLVNLLAVPGIGDTQCGFKLFRADVARALFRELGEHGWAFDVEILYRAQLAGYAVEEVPVRWQEIAGSKVRPLRDGYRMIVSLLRIRRKNSGFFRLRAQSLLTGRT